MIPYIKTSIGDIPTFVSMAVIGILLMVVIILCVLRKSTDPVREQNYILPKIVIAGLFGFISAGTFDLIAKIPITHTIKPQGISFYGGLIGFILALNILLRLFKNTEYSVSEWFDIITVPLVVFHIFGRIGCFLGGCCYGRYTKSTFGVYFPDNPSHNIFHYGQKCYPTQLFEALILCVILFIVIRANKKFYTYMICYSVGRFIIEFFRGDMRGIIFMGLSPAQIISVTIFITITFICIRNMFISKKQVGS